MISRILELADSFCSEITRKKQVLIDISATHWEHVPFLWRQDVLDMLGTLPKGLKGTASYCVYGGYVGNMCSLINRTLPHIVGNRVDVISHFNGNNELADIRYKQVYEDSTLGGSLILTSKTMIQGINGIINEEDIVDRHGYITCDLDDNLFFTLKPNTLYYLSSQAIIKYIPAKKKVFQCINRLSLPINTPLLEKNDIENISHQNKIKYLAV